MKAKAKILLAEAKSLLWNLEEEMSMLGTGSTVAQAATTRRLADRLAKKLALVQMELADDAP